MAKEDIIKKDIITELKDMESENDQLHLEPVNVVIGRYQPFTIGHLGMAKELEKINTQYTHIKLWKKEGLQLENSLKENRSGSNLWHIFILFSLMLLITESLLLKNWKNKTHIELDVK